MQLLETLHNDKQIVTNYDTIRDRMGAHMNILLKGKDGSIAIMTLVEGADKEFAIKNFKDSHPDGFYVDYFEFNGKLPLSREFRDAWTHDGKDVTIDATKAKDINLRRVRNARNVLLEGLDKEQLRYMSDADKLKELEAKKQVLRDLPANLNGLEWPELLERV